jgi:hypothetical protein
MRLLLFASLQFPQQSGQRFLTSVLHMFDCKPQLALAMERHHKAQQALCSSVSPRVALRRVAQVAAERSLQSAHSFPQLQELLALPVTL